MRPFPAASVGHRQPVTTAAPLGINLRKGTRDNPLPTRHTENQPRSENCVTPLATTAGHKIAGNSPAKAHSYSLPNLRNVSCNE